MAGDSPLFGLGAGATRVPFAQPFGGLARAVQDAEGIDGGMTNAANKSGAQKTNKKKLWEI